MLHELHCTRSCGVGSKQVPVARLVLSSLLKAIGDAEMCRVSKSSLASSDKIERLPISCEASAQ